jgi:23S rRNA pseudouridine1911/1915/1917 synthase
MIEPRRLHLEITEQQAGKTVDTLLRHELNLSGSAVRRAKRMPNGIMLNEMTVYTNAVVQEGQCLSVQVGDASAHIGITPTQGPLQIAYEDEDLLVIDKAAHLPVHPSMGHADDTLANYLLYYYEQIGLKAQFHPVNRLDRGTSGLMVVAKHAHAHERLGKSLHSGVFHREYLAVCEGVPAKPSGCIDLPIGRVPDAVLLREVRADGAEARTHYRVLRSKGNRSLVSLVLDTGRTHQIRVHMKAIGCPLGGDFLYGKEETAIPNRFALHSARLELCQPISKKQLSLASKLPSELAALLD